MESISEWIQCSKTLSDEDSSTQKVDGWKQLNTLKHYSVIDGADMVLTQHQNCRTLPRSPNGTYSMVLTKHKNNRTINRPYILTEKFIKKILRRNPVRLNSKIWTSILFCPLQDILIVYTLDMWTMKCYTLIQYLSIAIFEGSFNLICFETLIHF